MPEAAGVGRRRASRVLIYEPYPFRNVGGNLRTLAYVLRLIDRARVCPLLVAPFDSESLRDFERSGAEVIVAEPPEAIAGYGGRVLGSGVFGRMRAAWGLVTYSREISRIIKSRGVDVVYCNSVRSFMTVCLATWWTNAPVLLYVKGALNNLLIDRVAFFLADRILFFSASNRDDRYPLLVRMFRRKIDVLEIGLDITNIDDALNSDTRELREELDISGDAICFAYLGQLYPPKGVHFLIKAFAGVAESHPQARLLVIGDPILDEFRDYGASLRKDVADLELTNRVTFTGWRDDALLLLSQVDVLVHPSEAEGFGRAVLEAMALRKPVIASRVGGLRDSIRDGDNGFLVEPGDVETMSERMIALASDVDLRRRLGASARKTVEERHLIADKVAYLERTWLQMARK